MPYILKKDYGPFQEPMRALASKLAEDTHAFSNRNKFRSIFKYVYYEVNRKSMPALRYWTLAIAGGVMHNIPDEIRRRLKLVKAPRLPKKFPKYDPLIDNIVSVVAKIANDYNDTANPPKSYPGAYAGLDNFSLTTIFLRVQLEIAHANDNKVDMSFLRLCLKDMDKVTLAYYFHIAGPYEEVQYAGKNKETNGDLPEYIEIRRLLGITD